MAGTIIADTLTHSTAGSVTTDYVVNGSAKAWARLESATATLLDSFGAASSTDNGTGDHTITVTNAFDNANYSFTGTADKAGNYLSGVTNVTARTTTASRYRMYTDAGSLSDGDSSVLFHGDLA